MGSPFCDPAAMVAKVQDSILNALPAAPTYRVTSLIRNRNPLGPYSRTLFRAIWWP